MRNMSAKSLIALCGVAFLTACQTSGPDGVLSNVLPKKSEDQQVASNRPSSGTNPNDGTTLANTQNVLTDYCPAVRIRAGTETYRIYKGKDRDSSANIRYQATLTRVARECAYVGQNLEIKVGALGRVITGPAGGPGTFTMPIRVAVQQGDCSRHFQLHQQEASMGDGASNSKFEFVDETITIPAPTNTDVRIYLGFDETPSAKSSAKGCDS